MIGEIFQIGLQERHTVLTDEEIALASMVADGIRPEEIAKERRASCSTIKQRLGRIYRKLKIGNDPRVSSMLRLAVYWNSELFQIGLREQGLLR